jgi:hypothetical protein
MRPTRLAAAALVLVLAAVGSTGCGLLKEIGFAPAEVDAAAVAHGDQVPDEPAHVVVQQLLISFEGVGGPGVTRTKDEAGRLARHVLEEARRGRDFAELVRLYGDDRTRDGKCALANWGVPAGPDEVERQKRPRAFGAVAFSLAPGEVGLAEYDPNADPLGWHVMKREQ